MKFIIILFVSLLVISPICVASDKLELKYSKEELNAMDKWKNTTMNELISDALDGDAVALHMVGLAYLYGMGGFPIDVKQADRYFATSALLGFAPAIDKVKSIYLEDKTNPFLFFVYLNLTASSGHHEFTMAYHFQRRRVIEKCGLSMANEIERIANEKRMKIYQAADQLAESEDKMRTTFNWLYIEEGIVGEDVQYGMDYWEKFVNKTPKTVH